VRPPGETVVGLAAGFVDRHEGFRCRSDGWWTPARPSRLMRPTHPRQRGLVRWRAAVVPGRLGALQRFGVENGGVRDRGHAGRIQDYAAADHRGPISGALGNDPLAPPDVPERQPVNSQYRQRRATTSPVPTRRWPRPSTTTPRQSQTSTMPSECTGCSIACGNRPMNDERWDSAHEAAPQSPDRLSEGPAGCRGALRRPRGLGTSDCVRPCHPGRDRKRCHARLRRRERRPARPSSGIPAHRASVRRDLPPNPGPGTPVLG
jgi:hypothetical protein